MAGSLIHLRDRVPEMTAEEMVRSLVPPPQFDHVSFDNYQPDPEYPSQAEAREICRNFANARTGKKTSGLGFMARMFRGRQDEDARSGVYLDGGFGVGKTHLLAATWHAFTGRKYFGTFIEYTSLVGALGYAKAVEAFTGANLLAIDEFELDDPGDTMVMTRFLGALVETGTRVMATSNTPPNALGEGRFAAQDFLREITKLANVFQTVRIDGLDYRRRTVEGHAVVSTAAEVRAAQDARVAAGGTVAADDFRGLIDHLAHVHPSKYIKLIAGIDLLVLTDVSVLTDQSEALRFVAFIDRVYDAEIPIVASGVPLDEIFGGGMLDGGYRKKYLRAVSRLIASTAATAASAA